MKIIEVRDGFIKFEADKNIYLSCFVQVEGECKSYIAQVNQLKEFGNVIIASAKILFIFKDSELLNYDKTEPSKDATITMFSLNILENSIKIDKPIIIGKFADNSSNIVIDYKAFNKKMLVSVDDKNINNILVKNLSKQFENIGIKTIVIDTLGIINDKKYTAGIDFKLPLNKETLAFMGASCLNDATEESKSAINDVFNELAEYSETVPFVPFETLKSIIDTMVDKQHVFKLFILKNKLAKYQKSGYFATVKQEVDNLDKILNSNFAILDLSKLDSTFLNRYLEFIYEKIEPMQNIQVLLETANTVTKKSLKTIFSTSNTSTTMITHSNFKYLKDMQNLFDNFIIEPSMTNNSIFKVYKSFFDSMNKGMYLSAGEALNYIPVISNIQNIDEVIQTTNNYIDENIDEIYDNSEEEQITEDEDSVYEEITINDEPESIEELTTENKIPDNTEIYDAINEKSENVIDSIAKNLEEPDNINLFTEDDSDSTNENICEQVNDTEEENTFDTDLSDKNETIETSEENSDEIQNDITDDTDIINADYQEIENESVDEELLDISPVNTDIEEDEIANFNDDTEPEQIITDDTLDDSFNDENQTIIELDSEENLIDNNDFSEDENITTSNNIDIDLSSEPNIIPLAGEALENDFDSIVELDAEDTNDNDIIVDISNEDENINIDEDIEQQIIDDVDKVYTTRKDSDELEDISDSDLDLIDELNNDVEEIEEYRSEELEELSDSNSDNDILTELQSSDSAEPEQESQEILEKRDSSTPIVPVYDADIPQEDVVVSDPIQQGDAVVHAKYGNGVVEKMIKYGNKTLFAINFENIGRRLLDPMLTELKKV